MTISMVLIAFSFLLASTDVLAQNFNVGNKQLKVSIDRKALVPDISKLFDDEKSPSSKNLQDLTKRLQESIGGADAGGGTGVEKADGSTTLLDLFLFNPNFKDIQDPINKELEKTFHSSFAYPKGEVLNYFLLSDGSRDTYAEFKLVKKRLDVWRRTSPVVSNSISDVMERSYYSLYFKKLPPLGLYYLPENWAVPVDAKLSTIAYYSPRYPTQTFLSANHYLRMGVYSKAGVLIHEALRRIQLEGKIKIAERRLQELTAKILLTEPMSTETLDTVENIPNLVEMRKIVYVANTVCQTLSIAGDISVSKIIYQRLCSKEGGILQSRVEWYYNMLNVFDENYEAIYESAKSDEEKNLIVEAYGLLRDRYWYLESFEIKATYKVNPGF